MQNVGIAGLALVLVLASNAIGLLLQSRLREPGRRQEPELNAAIMRARKVHPKRRRRRFAPYAKASVTARPIPEIGPRDERSLPSQPV